VSVGQVLTSSKIYHERTRLGACIIGLSEHVGWSPTAALTVYIVVRETKATRVAVLVFA